MFEKDGQIILERDDAFPVLFGAYERYLSQQAVRGVLRERSGYDDSWHVTANLVRDKELLQEPENIPWDSDGVYELNATAEQLAAGLSLAIADEQPAIFDALSPEQKEAAVKYLRELKCLKAEDSFTWQASRAEQ